MGFEGAVALEEGMTAGEAASAGGAMAEGASAAEVGGAAAAGTAGAAEAGMAGADAAGGGGLSGAADVGATGATGAAAGPLVPQATPDAAAMDTTAGPAADTTPQSVDGTNMPPVPDTPPASVPVDAPAADQSLGTGIEPTGAEPDPTKKPVTTQPNQSNFVDKAVNSVTNDPLRALSFGLLAKNAFGTPPGGAGVRPGQTSAIADTQKAVSEKLLTDFQNGQLQAGDQQAIALHAQQQKAQADQYYAKAGLSNSSMHLDALRKIDDEADAQRSQALKNQLSSGLSAAGVSDPTLRQSISQSIAEDQAASQAQQNFLKMLAQMNTANPTTTQTGAPK